MPTLADIYSAIDSAKRRGSDLIRNPGASLQQIAGYGMDRANAARDQLYQATEEEGIGYGPKTQALAKQMAATYNPIGMTVWHGSPHVFQKFDLSKIGTGEGAQAYGSGMYMAQSPDLAQSYANKLTQVNGQAISDQLGPRFQYLNMLKQQAANGDANAAKNIPVIEKSIAELQNHGSVYKVDLPDTHIRRMLDWDAPIKDQPTIIRKLAKTLGMDMNDLGGDLLAKVGKDEAGRKTLQEAGIRGIKYLDAQSRDAIKGTRNYVVFDPNHLTILERNNEKIK